MTETLILAALNSIMSAWQTHKAGGEVSDEKLALIHKLAGDAEDEALETD